MTTLLRSALVRLALLACLCVAALAGPTRAQELPEEIDLSEEGTWAQLLRFGVRQLDAPGEFEIELGFISSGDDDSVRIESLAIRDSEGVWLEATGLEIDWDSGAAFLGDLEFNRISIEKLAILRPPVGRGDPPSRDDPEAGLEAEWPRTPVNVEIRSFEIREIDLAPPLLGERILGRMSGLFRDVGDEQSVRLEIERTNDERISFVFDSYLDSDDDVIAIQISAQEETGGLIGRSLGAPSDSALDLSIDLQGSSQELGFSARAVASDTLAVQISGVARWRDAFSIEATGVARVGRLAGPELRAAIGEEARLSLAVLETPDGAFRVDAFELDSRALVISAAGAVDPEADTISLDAAIGSPDPAALAGVLGLEAIGRLEGRARASGRLSSPEAAFDFVIEGLRDGFGAIESASVRATLAPEGETTTLEIDARLAGAAFADPDLAALLGASPSLTARGRYDPEEMTARLDAFALSGAVFSATGDAVLALDGPTLDADLAVVLADAAPFLGLVGVEGGGRGEVRLEVEGATLETVARASLSGRLEALGFEDPTLAELLGDRIELAVVLEDAGDAGVRVTEGRIETAVAAFMISGTVAPQTDAVDLSLVGDLTDPGAINRAFPSVSVGAFGFELGVEGVLSAPTVTLMARLAALETAAFAADEARLDASAELRRDERTPFRIALTTRGATSPIAELDAVLGDAPSFEAEGEYDRALGRLRLDRATLVAAGATASLSGTIGADAFGEDRVDLAYSVEAPDLSLVGPVAGAARLDGTLAGASASPRLDGRLESARLDVGGLSIAEARLDYAIDDLGAEAPIARLELAALLDGAPLAFAAEAALGGEIALRNVAAEFLGATIEGEAELPPGGGGLVGAFRLDAPDLAAFADYAGLALSGDARGTLRLTADGGSSVQGLLVEIEGDSLGVEGVSAGAWRLALGGPLTALDFDVAASGVAFGPIEQATFELAGRADLGGAPSRISVSRLRLENADILVDAAEPVSISIGAATTSVDAPAITAQAKRRGAEGRIALALAIRAGGLTGSLTVDAFPLAFLDALGVASIERGLLSGEAEIAPGEGSARFRIDGAAPALTAGAPFDADLAVDWRSRVLDASLTVEIGDGAPLVATAQLPLLASALPSVDENRPFSAALRWSGRAEDLFELMPLDGQVLEGALAIDLAADGAIAEPSFSGVAALTDGRYIAVDAGFALADLDLSLTADGRELAVDGRASDGGAGTVAFSGDVDPFSAATDIAITVRSARLIRRDDLTLMASGDVAIVLGGVAPRIAGAVEIEMAEARLIASGVEEPPLIDYRIAGVEPAESAAPSDATPIALDLRISGPRRLFARGRGLDSEWGGELRIGGTVDAPEIIGQIEARRGEFSLAGAPFRLARGLVTFRGTPNPLVEIRFELQRNGIEGAIEVDGPADDLEITLSSAPELPDEEVLPRLIFGQEPSQLSPIEAAQLAAGLSTLLRGDESAVDVARRLIGADRLTVGEGAAGDPVVGVGRYVSEGVYVEGRSGVEPSDRSVAVEIEVAPNVELESELGAEGNVGVGVQWKLDY